ncbi:MAG: hypothetical protein ACRCX2_17195 [Paraclostridium sp.]
MELDLNQEYFFKDRENNIGQFTVLKKNKRSYTVQKGRDKDTLWINTDRVGVFFFRVSVSSYYGRSYTNDQYVELINFKEYRTEKLKKDIEWAEKTKKKYEEENESTLAQIKVLEQGIKKNLERIEGTITLRAGYKMELEELNKEVE